MTTPDAPDPGARRSDAAQPQEDGRGVEIGLPDDAGGTFEPEEDPDDGPSA
ncbi:hypothetical protein O2V63_08680 [Modestobacter sp. VKM Ac-2977]|uniref:hypothetical protein n=1 Tax=Modestobacter sp. VKM Ac-2977 TaxID=3004131 RepID=UPI0022AB28AD|nr:hypothetical protein [Modestobacter sp. VKM Ac-2977]MCZ2820400.1 hypothetical protein [Modestobacter sp. VKM Ac-2977]